MSHYKRGIVDGVVHYCDNGWSTRKGVGSAMMLFPWCMTKKRNESKPAEPVIGRAFVTCLQCLGLRWRR